MISTLWLTLDAVGSFLLGLVLFTVPHIAGNFIFQRETDGVHWHLIRCVGGQFMAAALASYLLKNSNKVTHTVCYIMRIVAYILLLLLHFETRSVNPKLVNQQIMDVVKYGCFSGVFLNILMLLGNGWPIEPSGQLFIPIGQYRVDLHWKRLVGFPEMAPPSTSERRAGREPRVVRSSDGRTLRLLVLCGTVCPSLADVSGPQGCHSVSCFVLRRDSLGSSVVPVEIPA
ncbi:unnamed protein product, partial [Mesorhabditis belari]|uniref:Uncharacterized protein n=1 Tax=Mesorhabditis belari TaxID=2138241 RepID=A0AAF3ERX4_9BILA